MRCCNQGSKFFFWLHGLFGQILPKVAPLSLMFILSLTNIFQRDYFEKFRVKLPLAPIVFWGLTVNVAMICGKTYTSSLRPESLWSRLEMVWLKSVFSDAFSRTSDLMMWDIYVSKYWWAQINNTLLKVLRLLSPNIFKPQICIKVQLLDLVFVLSCLEETGQDKMLKGALDK